MTREDNELLCRVGPGTAMGDVMRRYWLPVFVSSELERDGTPKRTRILGEDLVGFRDSLGRVGLLDESCPHRGASLVLARNEACGLRCLYHGWKLSASGEVLEMPPEQEASTFMQRVRARSYPVYESAGLIYAYLGPPDVQPPPPDFDWMSLPDTHIMIVKGRSECNWAQALEGSIDSVHSDLLHRDSIRPTQVFSQTVSVFTEGQYLERPSNDIRPRLEAENTPYGFRYAAIRKPLRNAESMQYVRVTHFVAPSTVLFPGAAGWCSMSTYTPIDDEHTMFYWVRSSYDAPIAGDVRSKATQTVGLTPGVDLNPDYSKIRNRANNWLQDREAMQRGETFTGILGVIAEDMCVQESMGAILDRTKEHLGACDVGVIRMRQLMIDSARRLQADGEPPPGLAEPRSYRSVRADEGMVPLGMPWHHIGDPNADRSVTTVEARS